MSLFNSRSPLGGSGEPAKGSDPASHPLPHPPEAANFELFNQVADINAQAAELQYAIF